MGISGTDSNNNGPYRNLREQYFASFKQAEGSGDNNELLSLDANSLQKKYEELRQRVASRDGIYSNVLGGAKEGRKKKTKALSLISAPTLKEYEKKVIYCPLCGPSMGKMTAHTLKELLDAGAQAAYMDTVGGLPFADDTVFMHCASCNTRLIPQVDQVDKLDQYDEETEYKMTSLNSPYGASQKIPVMAAQKNRYNRKLGSQDKQVQARRRKALETLARFETSGPGGNRPIE